jgi:nucleoid-associated protein YgaU
MTSDAKIGLLLGLVFIFIIAFVINGLPRFRSTTNGSELTTNMVSSQNDTMGIGDREREVQDMIDWPEPPVEEPQTVAQTSSSSPLEDDEDVRFQIKLPETISYEPIVEMPEEPEQEPVVPVEPPQVESTQSTLAKLFDPPAPEPPKEEKKEEKIEFKKPPRPTPRPARQTRPVSPKVYEVSDGDNLAKIAQKFYGAEEGNTRANIMRIFEINKGQLTSPHDLKIGQKLIIPPLVVSQAGQNKTGSSQSDSLFEKVESIGRKLLQPDKPKKTTLERPKVPNGGKQYVVKEGDSLWKIASEQLGNGSRYKEILKLNTDVLEDEHSLSLGTTLKLPAR